MTISLAERFLVAYNSIDKTLKQQNGIDKYMSFFKLIDYTKKSNPVIDKFESDLKEFAELRNAIVHERVKPSYIIAEPHVQIVEKMEKILSMIQNPAKVIPTFKRKVVGFQLDTALTDVMKSLKTFKYTQFPMYDGDRYVGLLTENGIVGWLSHHINEEQQACIGGVKLNQVMQFEKHKENVIFLDRNKTVYEAKENFLIASDMQMSRLDAILITKTGSKKEPLLGIITAEDLLLID